jgi:hypothetical protein
MTDTDNLLAEYELSKTNPSREWVDYEGLADDLASEVRRLRAELDLARPVIDAAHRFLCDAPVDGTSRALVPFEAAVRAYRETRP